MYPAGQAKYQTQQPSFLIHNATTTNHINLCCLCVNQVGPQNKTPSNKVPNCPSITNPFQVVGLAGARNRYRNGIHSQRTRRGRHGVEFYTRNTKSTYTRRSIWRRILHTGNKVGVRVEVDMAFNSARVTQSQRKRQGRHGVECHPSLRIDVLVLCCATYAHQKCHLLVGSLGEGHKTSIYTDKLIHF